MVFNPCVSDQCTEDGTHCKGCGRSHVEIAETKSMVMDLVKFAQQHHYENIEDFAGFISKNLIKKYHTS